MTRNRFDNAIFAQAGACNPIAIAKGLVDAIQECRSAVPEEDPRGDPAVQLILHQLAHIVRCPFDWPGWEAATAACEAKASPDVLVACGITKPVPKGWDAVEGGVVA